MYWEYDSRIGRRWNGDPLEKKFPWQSPYATLDGNPIWKSDPTGMAPSKPDDWVGTKEANGNTVWTYDKNITTVEQIGRAHV